MKTGKIGLRIETEATIRKPYMVSPCQKLLLEQGGAHGRATLSGKLLPHKSGGMRGEKLVSE